MENLSVHHFLGIFVLSQLLCLYSFENALNQCLYDPLIFAIGPVRVLSNVMFLMKLFYEQANANDELSKRQY